MPNTQQPLTLDIGVKWTSEVRDRLSADPNTRPVFDLPGDGGHLLVWEQAKALTGGSVDPASDAFNFSGPPPTASATTSAGSVPLRPLPRMVPKVRPLARVQSDRYILLKKYEGVILQHDAETFKARFAENANDIPIVEAEFDTQELSESDQKMLVDGAAIVWTIGYQHEGSMRKRESLLYLRRLPPWTDDEVEDAHEQTQKMIREIPWS